MTYLVTVVELTTVVLEKSGKQLPQRLGVAAIVSPVSKTLNVREIRAEVAVVAVDNEIRATLPAHTDGNSMQ